MARTIVSDQDHRSERLPFPAKGDEVYPNHEPAFIEPERPMDGELCLYPPGAGQKFRLAPGKYT